MSKLLRIRTPICLYVILTKHSGAAGPMAASPFNSPVPYCALPFPIGLRREIAPPSRRRKQYLGSDLVVRFCFAKVARRRKGHWHAGIFCFYARLEIIGLRYSGSARPQ